jgi:hypothetical protein
VWHGGSCCAELANKIAELGELRAGAGVVADRAGARGWRTFVPSEPRSHDPGHSWIEPRRPGAAAPRAERGNEVFRDAGGRTFGTSCSLCSLAKTTATRVGVLSVTRGASFGSLACAAPPPPGPPFARRGKVCGSRTRVCGVSIGSAARRRHHSRPAPPFQGGEKCSGCFRVLGARRSNHWRSQCHTRVAWMRVLTVARVGASLSIYEHAKSAARVANGEISRSLIKACCEALLSRSGAWREQRLGSRK